MDDAWAQICPEIELERLECLQERSTAAIDSESDNELNIPDLLPQNTIFHATHSINIPVSKDEAAKLLRLLGDVAAQEGKVMDFDSQVAQIRNRYSRRPALMRALKEQQL